MDAKIKNNAKKASELISKLRIESWPTVLDKTSNFFESEFDCRVGMVSKAACGTPCCVF